MSKPERLSQEQIGEQEFMVTREIIVGAVSDIRARLRGAESSQREADARGLDNETGRIAARTALSLEQQAMGAIDLLGTLVDPSEFAPDCKNWYQIVHEPDAS